MNPINKTQLANFKTSFGIPGWQDNDAFEAYSINSVLNGLLSESVDPFKVHLSGTEFGLDGVAILMNGHVVCEKDELDERLLPGQKAEFSFHFFQSKTSQGFDYGEISKFFDAVKEFFTDSDAQSSDQLNDLWNAKEKVFQNILHHNPNIALHYCTTGADRKTRRGKQNKIG